MCVYLNGYLLCRGTFMVGDVYKQHKNEQDVFDYVVKHLAAQKEKSMTRGVGGGCQYRYEGRMCAVGCTMPDSVYEESFEGLTVSDLINVVEDESYRQYLIKFSDLLWSLQDVHDAYGVREWGSMLWCTADDHGLRFDQQKFEVDLVGAAT